MSQSGNYSPISVIKNKDFELGGRKGHSGGRGLTQLSQGSEWRDLGLGGVIKRGGQRGWFCRQRSQKLSAAGISE